jgi:hypothetical protein
MGRRKMRRFMIVDMRALLIVFVLVVATTVTVIHSTFAQVYVAPGFRDYAPNGMPDFDEKQAGWGPAAGAGVYSWCCPAAVADSLWWLDSEFESVKFAYPVPPPTISDHFALVTSYNLGVWDDHDPSNVFGLANNLAFLMDTDGIRTGTPHFGTYWKDVVPGIKAFLVQQGVAGLFDVQSQNFANFTWINNRVEAGQDVELFLEFWQQTGPGTWSNTTIKYVEPSLQAGHCVAVAGVNPLGSTALITDPYFDLVNSLPPAAHNDASLVSDDPYPISQFMLAPGPYPGQTIWELANYLQLNLHLDPTYHAFIRAAVATSPIVAPVHNVAITRVSPMKTIVGRGYGDNITVTAQNLGNFTEIFTVSTYANQTANPLNQTTIGSLEFNLTAGSSASKVIVWNTTVFVYGNYTITAYAVPVPGETNTTDNTYTYSAVQIIGLSSASGEVGITGYKLVLGETMNNPLPLSASIDSYYWSFSAGRWNGTRWVASGISNSSTPVTGYAIPANTTEELPYYVYLLPTSGSTAVKWNDWLKINFTFHWTYSSNSYSVNYTAELNVHFANVAGAAVTFPYLGASGKVGPSDLMAVAFHWNMKVAWTGNINPLDAVHIASITMGNKVGPADLMAVAFHWNQKWTNTPPPG